MTKNKYAKTIIWISWKDVEAVYIDGELATFGDRGYHRIAAESIKKITGKKVKPQRAEISTWQWLNLMNMPRRALRHVETGLFLHNAPERIPETLEELNYKFVSEVAKEAFGE